MENTKASLYEHILHGSPDFQAAIYDDPPAVNEDMLAYLHYHNEFELVVCKEGKIDAMIGGERYLLDKGEGVFVNSGTLHSLRRGDTGKCGFTAIVFSYGFVTSEYERIYEKYILPLIGGRLDVNVKLTEEEIAAVTRAAEYFTSDLPCREMYIKSSLLEALAMLVSSAEVKPEKACDQRSDMIKRVLDHIHENYSGEVTLNSIAESVHISREHLCRTFGSSAGCPPITYLIRYRVQKSAEMLRNGDTSVSEAAFACGFNSSSYYNKQFRRFMGCTPSEYVGKYRRPDIKEDKENK